METWGKHSNGSIYDMCGPCTSFIVKEPNNTLQFVFKMAVWMASCAELSNNLQAIEEIQALYWKLEKSATPTTLLLPWFPGPAKKRKKQATKNPWCWAEEERCCAFFRCHLFIGPRFGYCTDRRGQSTSTRCQGQVIIIWFIVYLPFHVSGNDQLDLTICSLHFGLSMLHLV